MNRYTSVSLLALTLIVLTMPVYIIREAQRLETAGATNLAQYISAGTDIYLTNCSQCHGLKGEGVGSMPQLNHSRVSGGE